jgi:hypothetical protein
MTAKNIQTPQSSETKPFARSKNLFIAAAFSAIPLISTASAGTTENIITPAKSESVDDGNSFEDLWKLATLYKNDSNPILEEFKLRGRYQGQYHKVDGQGGLDTEDDWEDRRSRFGFDAKMFDKKIELRFDFQSNDGFRDVYDGLVDAYIRWKPTDSFQMTVGRTKPLIGYYDWLQSTNAQPTFDRSQIFNQLSIDRATGVTFEGKVDQFTWQTGIYSNSVDLGVDNQDRDDIDHAFGKFDASYSVSAGVGYDFSKVLDVKKADFRIDYLHSERDEDANVLNRYENIVSSTFWVQDGLWSFVAEGFFASGGLGTDGDVFGGYLQGTYDILPKKVQLVGRYSYSTGDGDLSLRRQTRYESRVVDGRGDNYNAIYLGAQYFIYGDKLKFLAGAEYSVLDGGPENREFEGVSYQAGIRFSF